MPRRPEAGFAMLLVFLLAACVAISLYMETPRVVFEAQRNREQLLVDRGEQYRRAIQVFVRRYSRYPPTMEALDNTDNRRFLRQHYKDPMTGKDEWRLIHAGPGGLLLDSLVTKPPGKDEKTGAASAATTTPTTEVAASPWQQRRPSDGTLPSAQFQGGLATPGMDMQPDNMPTEPSAGGENQQAPPDMGIQPSATLATPPAPGRGYPGVPPVGVPGLPTAPGQPYVQQPASITAGQTPTPQAGPAATPAGQNPALDMIRQMLTRPNPQGMANIPAAAGAQPQMAGGIAGVASKLEAEGIKVFNDRTKINEWEFVYDPRQDRTAVRTGQPQGQGPKPGAGPANQDVPVRR